MLYVFSVSKDVNWHGMDSNLLYNAIAWWMMCFIDQSSDFRLFESIQIMWNLKTAAQCINPVLSCLTY